MTNVVVANALRRRGEVKQARWKFCVDSRAIPERFPSEGPVRLIDAIDAIVASFITAPSA